MWRNICGSITTLVITLLAASTLRADVERAESISQVAEITSAALSFVDSLDAQQRASAVIELDDPRRLRWNYMPVQGREGIALTEMTPPQREVAIALLQKCLAPEGYRKAIGIIDQEKLIGYLEKSRGPRRDPLWYHFCIYGKIAHDGDWGLSVEGHHLSLNLLLSGGRIISATPFFLGANPAEVRDNGDTTVPVGQRLLKQEEELGLKLIQSLSADQRTSAVISSKTRMDMDEVNKPQTTLSPAGGISASQMNSQQRDLLLALVRTVIENGPPSVLDSKLPEFKRQADQTVFAWWGGTSDNEPHSWSISSPDILILLYKAQSDPAGNPANHTHLLWRTPGHDFGS